MNNDGGPELQKEVQRFMGRRMLRLQQYDLRAGDVQFIPQHPQERHLGFDIDFPPLAIDVQVHESSGSGSG